MNPVPATLLVVDDCAANRDTLARLLRTRGYRVLTGNSGHQALALIRDHPVDLVLLDVMMQDMNGLDVLEKIRATRPATELPVIMATARDQSEDIVGALERGASDYVTKPLDVPVLLARIQTQLTLRRAIARIVRLEQNLEQRHQELKQVNELMKHDLEAAARIQEAFLPQVAPSYPGAELAWMFKPCARLAGDTLNVFALDDRYLGMYVLDVSGHGVAAALLAVTLSHFLSPLPDSGSLLTRRSGGTTALEVNSPADVAARLNQRFPLDPVREQYFTIVYGVLDLETGTLRFISAGHPGPIHLPAADGPVVLQGRGLPIGVGKDGYQERQLVLAPGDRLYLYSDGLVEAQNESQEVFGRDRLSAAIAARRTMSLAQSVTDLWQDLEIWCRPNPPGDDVSVLAVEFNPVLAEQARPPRRRQCANQTA